MHGSGNKTISRGSELCSQLVYSSATPNCNAHYWIVKQHSAKSHPLSNSRITPLKHPWENPALSLSVCVCVCVQQSLSIGVGTPGGRCK